MRRMVRVLAAALLLTVVSTAADARSDEPRPRVARAPVPLDGIAAIVDDVVIFRSQVSARALHFESTLSKDPTKRRGELAKLEKKIVQSLIEEILIAKDAKALGLDATEAEVNQGIAAVAQQNKMDRKQLEAEVAKAGFSRSEYQDEIRRQLIEQRWLMLRASGKIDRKKTPDNASFLAAIEKERDRLVADLRSHAFVEVR